MRKKSINNKLLYESIMTGISKAIKKLLLLNEMNHRPVLHESEFTDDDAEFMSDNKLYTGIQGLINASDKDSVFKFGTILFVKGGLQSLFDNNNLEIIADNFENPTFDTEELNNILSKHRMKGRFPVAFCFGKNDEGKYVFGLPGDGNYICFANSYVYEYIKDKAEHFSGNNYDNNVISIDKMVKDSHGEINVEQLPTFSLLDKIYTYRDIFNNKLNINAPNKFVLILLYKINKKKSFIKVISYILNINDCDNIWANDVDIAKGKIHHYNIRTDSYYSTTPNNRMYNWFVTFTV